MISSIRYFVVEHPIQVAVLGTLGAILIVLVQIYTYITT